MKHTKLNKQHSDINNLDYFYGLGMKTIQTLEISDGIMASSGQEIFGCIYGRDSLITSLKLLHAHRFDQNPYYLGLTKKVLEGLIKLQGKEENIESGEEPGKCIHEFRVSEHERLTKTGIPPWFTYPDGTMRNFDSIDATPLFLITMYRYLQLSKDSDFIHSNKHSIDLAIDWIFNYGDRNGDGFIDYQRHPERKFGGLDVHSWMDSSESLFHEDEGTVDFPVAPIEVQSYTYLALKLWSVYYKAEDEEKSIRLSSSATNLKDIFNKKFIIEHSDNLSFAHALDSRGNPLTSTRSNIGHVLWASETIDGIQDCIIDQKYIRPLVDRLFMSDMFESTAGIRTLSCNSRVYHPVSYHNGSIWPHDNSLIAEGMENLGFYEEADKIRKAIFSAYDHFRCPVELYVFRDTNFEDYKNAAGQLACREQAWSAASMIADALALKRNISK